MAGNISKMLWWIAAVIFLVFFWRTLGGAVPRVRQSRGKKLTSLLIGLRGAILGLALAIFLAVGLSQASGKRSQTPYYFSALFCGMSMLLVPLTSVGSVLSYLKEPPVPQANTP